MGKLFNPDNSVMRFLSRVADVLVVNLLTLMFFLPLVAGFFITGLYMKNMILIGIVLFATALPIGPALTAMNYILLKFVHNEEGYIVRSYFHSFKDNLVQSMQVWALYLVFFVVLALDFYVSYNSESFPKAMKIALIVALVIIYAVFLWTFPLLSHFENNIKGTLRNAALLTMGCFPRTLGMIAMTAIPFVVLYFGQTAVLPIIIMFGIAGPGYGCAYLYNPSLKKFEPKEETADKDPDAMPEALRDEPVRDKESE